MAHPLTPAQIDELLASAQSYVSAQVVSAHRLGSHTTWTTSHGNRLTAHAGDWQLTDGDDSWTVVDDVFVATYEPEGDGRYRKTATVSAVQIDHDFELQTLEGNSSGVAGDWLVRNPTGECWPVPAVVFDKRYRRAAPA